MRGFVVFILIGIGFDGRVVAESTTLTNKTLALCCDGSGLCSVGNGEDCREGFLREELTTERLESLVRCSDDGGYQITDWQTCSEIGGVALGLEVGQCCKADGTCSILDRDACELIGLFMGDGTTCASFTCSPIIGNCCDVNLDCTMTNGSCNGQFGGDGSVCANFTCEATVPTMSEWGLIATALLLLAAGTVIQQQRSVRAA